MYKVVVKFKDLQDPKKHIYEVGDEFPHNGAKVDKKRIEELAGTKNKIGKVLIEEVEEDVDADGAVSGTEELVRQEPDEVVREVRNRKRRTEVS